MATLQRDPVGNAEAHLHEDHEMLISRVDRLEEQMNTRMLAMQQSWREDIRELRQDFASMFKKGISLVVAVMTGLVAWEWYQIQTIHHNRVNTTKIVSEIVQRQEDMVDRLEDLKEFNEKAVRDSETKNKAFIDALERVIDRHIENGHRGD